MHLPSRRSIGRFVVVAGAIVLRPGTRANRALRRQLDAGTRRLRHFSGRLQGVRYRAAGGHPDPEASGPVLADRIRSALGPLEKRLDIPHVHVMAEGHVALLHGEVPGEAEADRIETAVLAVPGVLGVESYLHIGLGRGDTRPSAGRAVEQPSAARRRLLDAATSAGVDRDAASSVVRAILATFAERLPRDEREQLATHLPADVRSMFSPPRRMQELGRVRTVPALVGAITATADALPEAQATAVTRAVVAELRALVPEEAADVAAVLPAELRDLWQQAAPMRG